MYTTTTALCSHLQDRQLCLYSMSPNFLLAGALSLLAVGGGEAVAIMGAGKASLFTGLCYNTKGQIRTHIFPAGTFDKMTISFWAR